MVYEHAGHRKRMYEKIQRETLLDWEILEILLYPLVPRRNTVDLAHNLLQKFGSAVAVFFASMESLQSVKGIGENVAGGLYTMGEIYRRHFKVAYDPFSGIFNLEEFLSRARDMYKTEPDEVLDVYLLNADNRVISRHRRTDRMQGQVHLDTKWLGRILADEEVYGVVMVHNHPTGGARYSGHDDVTTRACQMACNMHGKILCDHVIFSRDEVFSYYKGGKLEKISEEYSMNNLIVKRVLDEYMQQSVDLHLEAEELWKRGQEDEEEKG